MANRRLTKKTPKNPFSSDNSTTTVAEKDNFFLSKKKSSEAFAPDNKSKKKLFNKAKWRAQKYSLKTKVENWKNKRAEFIRHQYRKEQKLTTTETAFNVKKIYDEKVNELSNEEELESRKLRAKQKRHKQFETTETRDERLKQIEKMKEEKKAKMDLYRKSRMERQKKLSARTKRGQPVMKGRMELLLEQIQKTV